MEVNEARRLKELERENSELKKMLAEEMLKNRVLSFVCEKSFEPGSPPGLRTRSGGRGDVFGTQGVSHSAVGTLDLWLSWPCADHG